MNWWSLPGPSMFVNSVVEQLGQGRSVFLGLPEHAPSRLATAIKRTLGDSYRWCSLTVGEDEEPLGFLYDRCVCDADPRVLRSSATLVGEPSFQEQIIWLDGLSPTNWDRWAAFFCEYEHASRNVLSSLRTHFIVPLIGLASSVTSVEAVALSRVNWNDSVQRLDMLLYSAVSICPRTTSLETDLATFLVAELATWDPELCEYLSGMELEHLIDPIPMLVEFCRQRGWERLSASSPHEEWCRGLVFTCQGKLIPHTAYLALQGRSDAIQLLIWKAEIGILMPYVEEQRRSLLRTYASRLAIPFQTKTGEMVRDLYDLEIGHIEYQVSRLTGVATGELARISRLKLARNSLSHFEPVAREVLLSLCRKDS
jgi:hypothetical protein